MGWTSHDVVPTSSLRDWYLKVLQIPVVTGSSNQTEPRGETPEDGTSGHAATRLDRTSGRLREPLADVML